MSTSFPPAASGETIVLLPGLEIIVFWGSAQESPPSLLSVCMKARHRAYSVT